jgi:hypothetical protein
MIPFSLFPFPSGLLTMIPKSSTPGLEIKDEVADEWVRLEVRLL